MSVLRNFKPISYFFCRLYGLVFFFLETMNLWIAFEERPFKFWREIWIQVLCSYLITIATTLLTVCHILLLVCPLGENLTDKFWSSLLKPCHSGILCVCLNFLLFIYRILQTFTSQIRIDFENSKIRWPKTTTYKIMLCSSTNPKIFWVFRKCFELQ